MWDGMGCVAVACKREARRPGRGGGVKRVIASVVVVYALISRAVVEGEEGGRKV